MRIISQSAKVLFPRTPEEGTQELKRVEYAGRNCYRSQGKITGESFKTFVSNLLNRKHESPLEFARFAVEITTSRDVLAELTRHRLASFAVESQRYVNESKEDGGIRFIRPAHYKKEDDASAIWEASMYMSEKEYNMLIEHGWKNEDARKVLPNSTACVICMSANLREWLHIFELRTSDKAYPEMRQLMDLIVEQFNKVFPDLKYERK